jgi:hypothetical protein
VKFRNHRDEQSGGPGGPTIDGADLVRCPGAGAVVLFAISIKLLEVGAKVRDAVARRLLW